MIKFIKISVILLLSFFALCLPVFAQEINAEQITQGEQIFELHCAGCHVNGGNIIRRGKNLKLKTLKRYQMDTPEAIINLVTNGKNNMSAFGDRLTKAEIENVTFYLLKKAQENWR